MELFVRGKTYGHILYIIIYIYIWQIFYRKWLDAIYFRIFMRNWKLKMQMQKRCRPTSRASARWKQKNLNQSVLRHMLSWV